MTYFNRLSALALLLFIGACGFPGNKMTKQERVSDMSWAFTLFEKNYAPTDLKKKNFGLDLAQLKQECITDSEADMENTEFMALFQKCIHALKDPHVSAIQMNNGLLPEFAKVAHLGFSGIRTRISTSTGLVHAILVRGILPESATHLKEGDLILKANGKSVDEILKTEILPYMDVGQMEASLTMASLRFAARTSMDMPLPIDNKISLEVLRGKNTFLLETEFVVEDLLTFSDRLQKHNKGNEAEDPGQPVPDPSKLYGLGNLYYGFDILRTIQDRLKNPAFMVGERVNFILENSFQFGRFNPFIRSLVQLNFDQGNEADRAMKEDDTVDDLVPDPLIPAKLITTDEGKTYAYIRIAGFPGEDEFVDEFRRMITKINDANVQGLVLDMADNGGGSLVHGMRMANMLHPSPLRLPSIQVRLNDNWMNAFRAQAHFGASIQEKLKAQKIVKNLKADMKKGLKISQAFSVAELDPFGLTYPKVDCVSQGLCLNQSVKIALVINEMCVSMCDIFASVVKENKIGVIIGQQSMGGGGNVTPYGLAPVSKMLVNMTESLILSPDGHYLENNGVKPDIYVDMAADRHEKFKKSLDKAAEYVTGQHQL